VLRTSGFHASFYSDLYEGICYIRSECWKEIDAKAEWERITKKEKVVGELQTNFQKSFGQKNDFDCGVIVILVWSFLLVVFQSN